MNVYNLHTLVRLLASFTDALGNAVDPTSVVAIVTDPKNVSQSPLVVHDSLGNYHADVVPAVHGTWNYAFNGTGAVIARGQGQFFVEPGA